MTSEQRATTFVESEYAPTITINDPLADLLFTDYSLGLTQRQAIRATDLARQFIAWEQSEQPAVKDSDRTLQGVAITEEVLLELGFKRKDAANWWLERVDTPSIYPTRVHVLATGVNNATIDNVLIEQAEYTGELAEGTGDSDWTWEYPAGCIHVVIRDWKSLAQLICLLRSGTLPASEFEAAREEVARLLDEIAKLDEIYQRAVRQIVLITTALGGENDETVNWEHHDERWIEWAKGIKQRMMDLEADNAKLRDEISKLDAIMGGLETALDSERAENAKLRSDYDGISRALADAGDVTLYAGDLARSVRELVAQREQLKRKAGEA